MQRLDKIRPHQAREGEVTASGALFSAAFICVCEHRCVCFACKVEFAFIYAQYALTSDVICASEVTRFIVSRRK